jgi:hypothetical protein
MEEKDRAVGEKTSAFELVEKGLKVAICGVG